jgi:hypothetical protein
MVKVCAYVTSSYAKQTYATESHDVRAWPGFEVVLDAIRRSGYDVEYAGAATAHNYDVVLVSITSDCDWWPFVADRMTWKKKDGAIVVVGGAGVLNVRPFLSFADCFVLGRGENIAPLIVKEHDGGGRFVDKSVVWSDGFSESRHYEIAQVDAPYEHEIVLTNGKIFKEGDIGCQRKCFFCGYTWQRSYVGAGVGYSSGSGAGFGNGNQERTIIDLLDKDPSTWNTDGVVRMVGVDGMSWRLRRKVNKRITREMLRRFLSLLDESGKPSHIKLYMVVGYPDETIDDWSELLEDISIVDQEKSASIKQWCLLVHPTPFRAMPATPCATWPMSYQNYRGAIAKTLKRPSMNGNIFFQGNRFWAVESMGTESLPTVILSALCLRGTEDDTDLVSRIATSKKLWKASAAAKLASLEKHVNIDRLFGRYAHGNLPTRYLRSHWNK